MKNEQQMLAEAYHDIADATLTCYDIDRLEDMWIAEQRALFAIDELKRLTRQQNRKTPHEI